MFCQLMRSKHKSMKSRFPLLITTALTLSLLRFPVAIHAADSDWDYLADSGGVSESHAGKAGLFRSYHFVTPDPIEKVVLWYAKRFGLPEDHSLIVAAKAGFSTLPGTRVVTTGYGHDTDKRQDHTTIAGSVTSEDAHITFLYRPDFSGGSDITVSLSTVTRGTSIVVLRPIAEAFRKGEQNATKAEQDAAGQPATSP